MTLRRNSCRGCGACEVEPALPVNYPDVETLVESVVRDVLSSVAPSASSRTIPVGVSARHMHITQENLERLFGPGYQLTKLRDLNQPGEFLSLIHI